MKHSRLCHGAVLGDSLGDAAENLFQLHRHLSFASMTPRSYIRGEATPLEQAGGTHPPRPQTRHSIGPCASRIQLAEPPTQSQAQPPARDAPWYGSAGVTAGLPHLVRKLPFARRCKTRVYHG